MNKRSRPATRLLRKLAKGDVIDFGKFSRRHSIESGDPGRVANEREHAHIGSEMEHPINNQPPKPTVQILPHPPDVIDVDPEILSSMKSRLAGESAPKQGLDPAKVKAVSEKVQQMKSPKNAGTLNQLAQELDAPQGHNVPPPPSQKDIKIRQAFDKQANKKPSLRGLLDRKTKENPLKVVKKEKTDIKKNTNYWEVLKQKASTKMADKSPTINYEKMNKPVQPDPVNTLDYAKMNATQHVDPVNTLDYSKMKSPVSGESNWKTKLRALKPDATKRIAKQDLLGDTASSIRSAFGSQSSPPAPTPVTPAQPVTSPSPTSIGSSVTQSIGRALGKDEIQTAKTYGTDYDFDQPDLHTNSQYPGDSVFHSHSELNDPSVSVKPSLRGLMKADKVDKGVRISSVAMPKEWSQDDAFVRKAIKDKLVSLQSDIAAAVKSPTKTKDQQLLIDRYQPQVDAKTGKLSFGRRDMVFNDAAGSVFTQHKEKFHPTWSTTNSKLNNEAISSWNIPAKTFCPGAKDCKSHCYAMSGPIAVYVDPSIRRWINHYASTKDIFVDELSKHAKMISKANPVTVKDWDKVTGYKNTTDEETGKTKQTPIYADKLDDSGQPVQRNWTSFRIHDTGDFHSADYADKISEVARRSPELRFHAYTKSLGDPTCGEFQCPAHKSLRAAVDRFASLPNTKVIQSVGGEFDGNIDPNKPHAVIFENRDQLKQAGYVDAYNYDSVAADPKNVKVGLAIHGPKSKSFSLDNHLRDNQSLMNSVKSALSSKITGSDKVKKTEGSLRSLIKKSAT